MGALTANVSTHRCLLLLGDTKPDTYSKALQTEDRVRRRHPDKTFEFLIKQSSDLSRDSLAQLRGAGYRLINVAAA